MKKVKKKKREQIIATIKLKKSATIPRQRRGVPITGFRGSILLIWLSDFGFSHTAPCSLVLFKTVHTYSLVCLENAIIFAEFPPTNHATTKIQTPPRVFIEHPAALFLLSHRQHGGNFDGYFLFCSFHAKLVPKTFHPRVDYFEMSCWLKLCKIVYSRHFLRKRTYCRQGLILLVNGNK